MILIGVLYFIALFMVRGIWRESWFMSAFIAIGNIFTIAAILVTIFVKK